MQNPSRHDTDDPFGCPLKSQPDAHQQCNKHAIHGMQPYTPNTYFAYIQSRKQSSMPIIPECLPILAMCWSELNTISLMRDSASPTWMIISPKSLTSFTVGSMEVFVIFYHVRPHSA